MKCVRYSAGEHSRLDESRVQHLSFGSGPGFPVKSNDKGRISITLAVPPDLKPTIRSKLIEVTYMVNVAVKFPGSSEEYQVPERSKRIWLVRKDTIDDPSTNQKNLSQKGSFSFYHSTHHLSHRDPANLLFRLGWICCLDFPSDACSFSQNSQSY